MRAYIVETEAVRHNLDVLMKKADKTPIWAVLKGNGYGLGVEPMAQLCWEAGIRRFAVTELSEAKTLRSMTLPGAAILLLRPTQSRQELELLLDLDVIATIGCAEDAAALNAMAGQRDVVAEAHVKVDTGMGRYGFQPSELEKILAVYRYNDHIAVSGVYTHFHSAFCSEKATFAQADAFRQVIAGIEAAGIEPGTPHCANSHAFLRWPELHMGGVRLGSALLGRVSVRSDLRRVGWCEASVDEVRWLPAGHTCGYGAAWKARRPVQTAVINVGWYHGFTNEYGRDIFRVRDCLRAMLAAVKHMLLRKKIYVTINGKRCPVLGHVGMLHTVCDTRGVPVSVGDRAILEISPLQARAMPVEYR